MQALKLEDYPKIQYYLDIANYEGYNSNFITMMMWNHEYHIQYEQHDHYLIMLFTYKNQKFFSMPFTTKEYYQEAIEYMIEYSAQHHFKFMIDCAVTSFVEVLKNICPNQFLFERTPYNDDYIYERTMLQTLSGKKMQKRRNHYHAFVKNYPDYIYRELDPKMDFDIILHCLQQWGEEKGHLNESMISEIYGIMYLLSSKKYLDFKIGGIFIKDKMEAFIIGSKLPHDTIQIHVEKANANIRGLYPAILKEFLEHHYPDQQYINREEDMGLENLRKAKLALHPIKKIEKYKITLRHLQCKKATQDDLAAIKSLWIKSFEDETSASTDFYFKYHYTSKDTYLLKDDQKIISMMQIKPMQIHLDHQNELAYFILGVCTDPLYQKQGCMKILFEYVLHLFQSNKIYLQAYHPEIYKPFNFLPSHMHQVIEVDPSWIIENPSLTIDILDATILEKDYQIYTYSFNEFKVRTHQDFEYLLKRCEAFDDQCVIIKNMGYMIYHEYHDHIYISEFIYLDSKNVQSLLSYFYSFNKTLIVECDMKIHIPGNKKEIVTMLSNFRTNRLTDHQFINEIY